MQFQYGSSKVHIFCTANTLVFYTFHCISLPLLINSMREIFRSRHEMVIGREAQYWAYCQCHQPFPHRDSHLLLPPLATSGPTIPILQPALLPQTYLLLLASFLLIRTCLRNGFLWTTCFHHTLTLHQSFPSAAVCKCGFTNEHTSIPHHQHGCSATFCPYADCVMYIYLHFYVKCFQWFLQLP